METIKLTVSKNQVARAVVEQLRDYFSCNSMPRVIGLNDRGEVDYWHKVHGREGMILELADTDNESLWGDYDPTDLLGTTENIEHMVKWFDNELIDSAIERHNQMAREFDYEEIELIKENSK